MPRLFYSIFMLVPAASMLMLTASASIGLLFIAVLAAGVDPVPELPHGHAGGLLRRNARIKGMQLLIGVVLAQGQPKGLGLSQILRTAGIAVRVALTGSAALGTAEDLLLLHLIVAAHHDGEKPIIRQALLDGVTGDDLLQGVIIAQEPDIQLSCQGSTVIVEPFHGDDPVEPVDLQLHRGVDVNADGRSRGEVGLIAAQTHHQ